MTTARADVCKASFVTEGCKTCVILHTFANNHVADTTLDLSATNANSISGPFSGFDTIYSLSIMPPHTPVTALGYLSSATVSGTTATLNLLKCTGSAAAMTKVGSGSLLEAIQCYIIVRGM